MTFRNQFLKDSLAIVGFGMQSAVLAMLWFGEAYHQGEQEQYNHIEDACGGDIPDCDPSVYQHAKETGSELSEQKRNEVLGQLPVYGFVLGAGLYMLGTLGVRINNFIKKSRAGVSSEENQQQTQAVSLAGLVKNHGSVYLTLDIMIALQGLANLVGYGMNAFNGVRYEL